MISVFTYQTPNFQALADVTLPSIHAYCARHGYRPVNHLDTEAHDDPRPFGFRKMEAVLEYLRTLQYGRDVVTVLDLDVLITNHAIRLESFIDPLYDLFATHDANGFNSGVYLIRSTIGMEKFLEDAIGRWGQPGVYGEQDAMRDALKGSFGDMLKILPQSSFNSYLNREYPQFAAREEGNWRPGDLLLHLPGMSNKRRIEIFTSPEIQNAIVE